MIACTKQRRKSPYSRPTSAAHRQEIQLKSVEGPATQMARDAKSDHLQQQLSNEQNYLVPGKEQLQPYTDIPVVLSVRIQQAFSYMKRSSSTSLNVPLQGSIQPNRDLCRFGTTGDRLGRRHPGQFES
eukprot:4939516-Pyramimonas_sp.AAC.1